MPATPYQFSSATSAQPQTVVADFGNALPINFSGQVVGAGTGEIGQPSAFGVGGWVRRLTFGESSIFNAQNQFWLAVHSNGTVSAGFIGGGAVVADITITDLQWHYVSCSFLQDGADPTSGILDIYIDGSHSASGDVKGSQTTGPTGTSIGDFMGALDFVSWCLWSTSLPTDAYTPFFGDPKAGLPDDGLVAAFGFAGGTVADLSGNGHTLVSPPTLTWHTPCLQLTGTVDTAAVDALNPGGTVPYSVLTWVDVTTDGSPILANGQAGQAGIYLAVGQGMVVVILISTGITLTSPITEGWHHVAVIYDGTDTRVYVDASVVASTAVPASSAPTPNFVIGSDLVGNTANNLQLQGLSVWTSALAAADIVDYMTGAAPLGVPGCVGFFPFTDPGEGELGNTVTFNPSVVTGTAGIVVVDTPVAANLVHTADNGDARPLEPEDSAADVHLHSFSDLRRIAAALPRTSDGQLPGVSEADVADGKQWYEQFLGEVTPALADRLRAEFEADLRLGLALSAQGNRVGGFELRVEGAQTVCYYHREEGPVEVGRVDEVLPPYTMWVLTILMDIAGIIASIFGILTTAGKIRSASELFRAYFPQLGAAAAANPGNLTGSAQALNATWRILQLLWNWRAFGTLVWALIKASWWTVAFTVASIVLQIVAMVTSGGALLAVKFAQMGVAVGILISDLAKMPSMDAESAPTGQVGALPSAAGSGTRGTGNGEHDAAPELTTRNGSEPAADADREQLHRVSAVSSR